MNIKYHELYLRKNCRRSIAACVLGIILSILLPIQFASAQGMNLNLSNSWTASDLAGTKSFKATVPGTVYTDLFRAGLIPNPIYGNNEKLITWIDSTTWVYTKNFTVTDSLIHEQNLYLVFDGLDTYADVYFNDTLLISANNMFRKWEANVHNLIKKANKISIIFHPALLVNDGLAYNNLPQVLPDNNRVYSRKAQFQFGWDWGPRFVNCGIWKNVYLEINLHLPLKTVAKPVLPLAELIQEKDSIGTSFYFNIKGRPVYIQGANWIPASIFLPEVKKADYRKLLQKARDAHMNMLRVWGGGIYEDDYFYELCDEYGIMVWQDFMFAGGIYPGDAAFMQNVKEELRQQINRLKKYSCIVLWCGNNEIDEAWHNWGWQDQYNIHGEDSAKIWKQYTDFFSDSLQKWVQEFDGVRPYISSSPKYGWGREQSYTEGDSHYWGLWWGLQPWEAWEDHTGRFVSEYGMQSMPSAHVIKKNIPEAEQYYNSPVLQSHQKASDGMNKLHFYLNKYFIDSNCLASLSLQQYIYTTQCLQYYILKNSIAMHQSQKQNMGTLLWQLNNCWPAVSWSILNYDASPRGAYYAVKEAYSSGATNMTDAVYPKLFVMKNPEITCSYYAPGKMIVKAKEDADYIFINNENNNLELSDNYFSLRAGEEKIISFTGSKISSLQIEDLKVTSWYDILLAAKNCHVEIKK